MARYYKINSEDVSYKIIDNQAVILSLKMGDYYSLNESGSFLFEFLENKITVNELVDKLVEKYGINRETAEYDIKLLLKDLISEKLLIQEEID